MLRLLFLLLPNLVFSQASLIDYPHPFHSTYTNSGIVVSQNYLSSDIGKAILDKGGNAVDAAIAVGFSLTATLPRAGNIGGGGFMQVFIEKDKTVITIDFRSMAPKLATREFYQEAKEKDDDVTRKGYKAIAVPGTVAGLFKAHELYGTIPMSDLIQPTIDLLEQGIPITQDLYLAINKGRYIQNDHESNKIYKENLSLGGKLKIADLVKTLKIIQVSGRDGFYKGEIADLIHEQMIINDGLISMADLAQKTSDLGYESVAITDNSNLFGFVNFYQTMRANGIKPICGSEMTLEGENSKGQLTLLAKDLEGYKNLMKLISHANTHGKRNKECFINI